MTTILTHDGRGVSSLIRVGSRSVHVVGRRGYSALFRKVRGMLLTNPGVHDQPTSEPSKGDDLACHHTTGAGEGGQDHRDLAFWDRSLEMLGSRAQASPRLSLLASHTSNLTNDRSGAARAAD